MAQHRAPKTTHRTRTILLGIGVFLTCMWAIGHAQQAQAPAMATDTLYVCTSEDGSDPDQAFPCLWEAQAQGNGQGMSYVLTGQ